MNADEFNAAHPVGTPVFAYPACRPEDCPNDRRLVTRTREPAEVLGGHTDVVWVEGEGSCIALDHVDVVAEGMWQTAKGAEVVAAAAAAEQAPVDTLPAWLSQCFDPNGAPWDVMSHDDRSYWEHQARAVRQAVGRDGFKTPDAELASAVTGQGALPMPAGPVEQSVNENRRERYAAALYEATHPGSHWSDTSMPEEWRPTYREEADAVIAVADAEQSYLRKDRDAWRDQRNGVFLTNQKLLAELEQEQIARLRAENETRTARRELAEQPTRPDVLREVYAAIEDPEQRKAVGGGLGWETARDVVHNLLRQAGGAS